MFQKIIITGLGGGFAAVLAHVQTDQNASNNPIALGTTFIVGAATAIITLLMKSPLNSDTQTKK